MTQRKKVTRTKKKSPAAGRASAATRAKKAGTKAAPRVAARPAGARSSGRGPSPARIARAQAVLGELHRLYPDATCALQHRSAFELLVATILSAQSTDATVNRVTPALFARWPDARALSHADPDELEQVIHATGFFRQKAKSLLGASQRLVEVYGGEVPRTLAELITLPGVARKTANVVLGTWFDLEEGIVVDTHVGRLAHRLDLTWSSKDTKDAVKIEQDLMRVVPRGEWTFLSHGLILHGRAVCTARKPACAVCALAPHCPSAFRV